MLRKVVEGKAKMSGPKGQAFQGLNYFREYSIVDGGMDMQRALVEVSRILGHNRPEVTKIYLGPLWKEKL